MEGAKQGIEYAKSTFNQQIQNANVDGFREGYDEGRDEVEGLVKHYEAQIEMALQDERSKWEGHGDICLQLSVSPSTCDSTVQSDPICLPPTTSSSTQTPPKFTFHHKSHCNSTDFITTTATTTHWPANCRGFPPKEA